MSSAFLKENDDLWLRDIAPTMDALIHFLTRENGGIRIIEKESYFDPKDGNAIYKMSDGFEYTVADNKWICMD